MKSCHVCGERYFAKGLCRFHYHRKWKGIPLTQPKQIHDGKQGCRIDNCEGKHWAKGLCRLHDQRQRNGLPLEAGNLKGLTSYRSGLARKWAMAELPDDIREAYGG